MKKKFITAFSVPISFMPLTAVADVIKDNRIKYKILATITLGLLAGPMAAQAVEVQSSTTVFLTMRDCIAGATVCDDLTGTVNREYGGFPGDVTADASLDDTDFGTTSGSAELAGGTLSASATSLPLKRNGANSATLQRYTYMGSVPVTLTYDATLTYNQTVPAENAPFQVKSGAFAEIFIFTTSDALIEAGTTEESNWQALWFLNIAPFPTDFALVGDVFTVPASNVTESGTKLLSLTVNVNPGDEIWLGAQMQSLAANGADVDATLVTSIKPQYSCAGFESPADKELVVRKPNRVLPLRMSILDSDGMDVSDIVPPVVNVNYVAFEGATTETIDELDYAGKGDDGNQFVFNGSQWAFNLKTKGLAAGTYTFTAVSGDPAYVINPTCEAAVIIQ